MLNLEELSYTPLKTKGVRYVQPHILNPNDVYVPTVGDEVRNKARLRMNPRHVTQLMISIRKGIDYGQCPPVIRKLSSPMVINGKSYRYELVAGFHRMDAFKQLGITEWVFDEYQFGVDGVSFRYAIRTFQVAENNKLPALPATKDDVVVILLELTDGPEPEVEKTEKAIEEWVEDNCSFMHGNVKNAVIRKVVDATGAARDWTTFTYNQLLSYMGNRDNYEDNEPTYKAGWEYDKARDKLGATVLERYEYEFVYHAMQKLSAEDRESYFICHTSAPSEKISGQEKRQRMMTKFDDIEQLLLNTVEFYYKNGRWPWTVEKFVAQDNTVGESGFLDPCNFPSKSLNATLTNFVKTDGNLRTEAIAKVKKSA